ncbi:MAG: hypothetical protein IPH93_08575 [Saprospiraceae bacterium]|nr:hypothetical protein [Saprospiraceae bacterium]MBK7810551.1 hypothetical protein [Saprospiraceae bacterium]MBK9630141.1 hypothetical protein [Saprospiraceae bacterium]
MDRQTSSDIRNIINSFLDHEMKPEDQTQFLQQVQSNSDLRNELMHERIIRTKLKENIRRPHLSEGFIDKLKNKLPY